MSKSHCGSDACPGDVYDPASCECGCERCTREDEHDQQAAPHRDRIAALTADLATAIAERDEARRMLAECDRERDRYQSALRAIGLGCTGMAHAIANAALEGGTQADSLDAAKSAADAHLVAARWWPHKAGEAK